MVFQKAMEIFWCLGGVEEWVLDVVVGGAEGGGGELGVLVFEEENGGNDKYSGSIIGGIRDGRIRKFLMRNCGGVNFDLPFCSLVYLYLY